MSHAHQSATVSLTTVHLCSCVNGLICLTPGRLRRADGRKKTDAEGRGGGGERLGWGVGGGTALGTYLCPRVSAIVTELWSCLKVGVPIPGSLSLIVLIVYVDVMMMK